MSELTALTLAEARDGLRDKSFSATELTEAPKEKPAKRRADSTDGSIGKLPAWGRPQLL